MPETVKRIVSRVVAGLGYRAGQASNWYKDFAQLIHVVGLQKSRWGGDRYLETGVWLKAFGPDERPKYYECHVRLRLATGCGLDLGEIDSALREDDFGRMDQEERRRLIGGALKLAEADFFGRARNLIDLRSLLTDSRSLELAVDKRVRELLRLPGA
jgi:hypothetical protein